MNRSEAEEFLLSRINYEHSRSRISSAEFNLDRMRILLARLGDPQRRVPTVHLAGTKGKGSTANMISACLLESGYSVGLYTSPHLESVEERIALNGRSCTPERLVELVDQLRPHVLAMDEEAAGSERGEPTYFEITTAMAMLDFAQQKADVMVLEVGLGGRLDSTNVCEPCVTVITNISFDHTKQLGNTLAAIAGEKAGIIKTGIPVICGETKPEALSRIEEIAAERSAPLIKVDIAFGHTLGADDERRDGDIAFEFWQKEPHNWEVKCGRLGLAGQHQVTNASIALATMGALTDQGWSIAHDQLPKALSKARCSARVEIIQQSPLTILDSAHNIASVHALVEFLQSRCPSQSRRLVFATSEDKDAAGMLRILEAHFQQIILTEYSGSRRAYSVDKLAGLLNEMNCDPNRWTTVQNSTKAWRQANQNRTATDVVVVAGSFFLAAELRPLMFAAAKGLTPQP